MDTEEFRTLLKQELTIAAGALGGIDMKARYEQLSAGLDRCSPALLAAATETFVSNGFDAADLRRMLSRAIHGSKKRANGFLRVLDKCMHELSDVRQNKVPSLPI